MTFVLMKKLSLLSSFNLIDNGVELLLDDSNFFHVKLDDLALDCRSSTILTHVMIA